MDSRVKYSRLPTQDDGTVYLDSNVFDYSSAFSYEPNTNFASQSNKFRSAFTYGNEVSLRREIEINTGKSLSADGLARFLVTSAFMIVLIFTFPVTIWFCFKKVPVDKRLVVFRLGRLHSSKGPGLVFILPLLDRHHSIDVGLKAFSVPPKQILTEDGAVIEVGADIYFQIKDVNKAVTRVQNLDNSTRVLLQTSLSNILVQKSLAEVQAERKTIAQTLMTNSNETCRDWGVEISRAELSQIKVLGEPVSKPRPQLMMPPGLPGLGNGGGNSAITSALTHLASAVASKQGDKTKEMTEALSSIMTAGTTNESFPPFTQPQPQTTTRESTNSNKPTNSCKLEALSNCTTPEQLIEKVKQVLSEDLVSRVGYIYQFEIAGKQTEIFYLNLKHGSGSVGKGPYLPESPSASLSLSFNDLREMLAGRLQPFQAFMSGVLRVSGDKSVALRLEELVKAMAEHEEETGFTSIDINQPTDWESNNVFVV